ncbi:MAG: hypothetical protein MUD15_12780, partial [Desulfobacterota bacterium]|nr:hypothetical protein [Thermodesulfobacteriota bacterium]
MAGRRAGYCSGADMPGYAGASPGYGYGRGRGCRRVGSGNIGWGWRNRFFASGLPRWMLLGEYGVQVVQTGSSNEKDSLR